MPARVPALAGLGLALALAACSNSPRRAADAAVDGPPGPESSCFDGLDNNGDRLFDCADPTCAAVAACVEPAPAGGWTGPAALYAGAAPVPACPAPYTMTLDPGGTDLAAGPATCAACTCGPPTGGACTPAGGAATVPAPTFTTTARACAMPPTTATGCPSGVCRPIAPPSFAGQCIVHTGDQPCPGPPYTNRHVFQEADDTRGCTPCTCSAPTGGACTPSGGKPTGTAAPGRTTTFCCR